MGLLRGSILSCERQVIAALSGAIPDSCLEMVRAFEQQNNRPICPFYLLLCPLSSHAA